jgi:hypothetical protein
MTAETVGSEDDNMDYDDNPGKFSDYDNCCKVTRNPDDFDFPSFVWDEYDPPDQELDDDPLWRSYLKVSGDRYGDDDGDDDRLDDDHFDDDVFGYSLRYLRHPPRPHIFSFCHPHQSHHGRNESGKEGDIRVVKRKFEELSVSDNSCSKKRVLGEQLQERLD